MWKICKPTLFSTCVTWGILCCEISGWIQGVGRICVVLGMGVRRSGQNEMFHQQGSVTLNGRRKLAYHFLWWDHDLMLLPDWINKLRQFDSVVRHATLQWQSTTAKTGHDEAWTCSVLTTASDATEIDEIVVVGVSTPHRLFKITIASWAIWDSLCGVWQDHRTTAYNAGPISNEHWFNVSCTLRCAKIHNQ